MKYRPEIDGLRTVAVIPVILFHAGFSIFSGGYVGVDVFFVISGYLITTILIGEREAGTYSLLGFYERRARRILPALFFVLICTIPFAWQWMPPDPFEDYARSLAFASLFISNVHFIEHSGYFDTTSQLRPLLHTWSLAVEEQYYLLFPLVLWLMGMFSRPKFLAVFLGLSVISLGIAEWGIRNYPLENFFFTPSRLWELLGGSICAAILFGRAQLKSDVLALLGLALILFSIFYYDTSVRFPSLYALVPIGGAMLVILFAAPGTIVARMLSLKIMVGIGLLSYSAYLWHQPLFVFARYRSITEPTTLLMCVLIVTTLVLAWVSWKFVEAPFRKRTVLSMRGPLLGVSAVGILAFAIFGFWGDLSKGVPSRLDDYWADPRMQQIKALRIEGECIDTSKDRNSLCVVYQPDAPKGKVALLGDSHARALLPAFDDLSKTYDLTIFRGVKAACPPIIGVFLTYSKEDARRCFETVNRTAADVVKQEIDTVILVARWSVYASGDYSGDDIGFMVSTRPNDQFQNRKEWKASFEEGIRRTVEFYRKAGIRVVLLRQVPQQKIVPENVILQSLMQGYRGKETASLFEKSFVKREDFEGLSGYADSVLSEVAEKFGAEILSLNSFFEHGDRYAWFKNGSVLMSDSDHLTVQGAREVAPLLIEHFSLD